MSIKIAGTDISRVYKGTTLINKIYAGLWNIHEDLNNEGIQILAII